MSENFTSNQEAIIEYARFAAAKWDELEPWCSKNAERYYPDATAFGAASSNTNDIEYQFWPLTPEEYSAHTGLSLDPSYDPGPGVLETFGSTTNDVVGWASKWLLQPPVVAIFGDTDAFNQQVGNWFYYYTARGPDSGVFKEPSTPSDPPWADKLHTDWADAIDNRLFEVDEIRGEIAFIIPLLILVADKYAETDLANAIDLDGILPPDRQDSEAHTLGNS